MANRIYIAIGLLVIMVMAAAYLVPRFIDWDAYKPRMEALAATALGTEVTIAGTLEFTLLPQPRLRMTDVWLGPDEDPVGAADAVEADFSLMDFLRDRYTVTDLVLIAPQINLQITESGTLATPIHLAETTVASNISIVHARFSRGTFRLNDQRTGETLYITDIGGDMRVSALRGPFVMQGRASHGGVAHQVRISTSAMNAAGAMQVTAFARPEIGRHSISLEGLATTGILPRFEGRVVYRQTPDREEIDAARGDLVFESMLEASSTQVLLPNFTILPDENQLAARLTGAASIALGDTRRFEAVVSGGVVTLAQRDAREDGADQPYELIRLLSNLPDPLIPPLPGRIGMDIAELNVRGVALREVRLDARSDGEAWQVDAFTGRLAGDTAMTLEGVLSRAAGWPAFEGRISLDTQRLDAFSTLWKRPGEASPLFNMAGSLAADLQLSNESLRLSEGRFVIAESGHDLAATVRFGSAPRLDLDLDLGTLTPRQSQALAALLPPVDPDGRFGTSFPAGSVAARVGEATLLGQRLAALDLVARWGEGPVAIERARVGDFGGLSGTVSGSIGGTLAAPVIWGEGSLALASDASIVSLPGGRDAERLLALAQGNLPGAFDFVLDPPLADGVQTLQVEGRAGALDFNGEAEFALGLPAWAEGLASLRLEVLSDGGPAMFGQFGLRPLLLGEDGMLLTAYAQGYPRDVMGVELTIEGGGERLDFSGDLLLSDLSEIGGSGRTSFLLSDLSGIAAAAGAEGVFLPEIEGQAELSFVGGRSVNLTDIAARMAGSEVTGRLAYADENGTGQLSGDLSFETLEIEALAALIAGPGSLIPGEGLWPEGPMDLGESPRDSRGRIAIGAPQLLLGDELVIDDVGFDLSWDGQETRLRGLTGAMAGGRVSFEVALCCAGQFAEKTATGRFGLDDVDLAVLLPQPSAAAIDGRIDAGGRFQGTGGSLAELIARLSGEGSFTIADFRVDGLSPEAFVQAAAIDNIVEMDPEALSDQVVAALESGPFAAPEVAGVFALGSGVMRVSNLAIDGEDARLLGSGGLQLADLGLSGDWTLNVTRGLGGNGLINETTGRIGASVGGRLDAPERSLDLSQMVDAIQMRAYEIELDELERLRAEDEARRRAAAEERARQMEEQARIRLEELVRQAEEEAAARAAAEEADEPGPDGGLADEDLPVLDLEGVSPLVPPPATFPPPGF